MEPEKSDLMRKPPRLQSFTVYSPYQNLTYEAARNDQAGNAGTDQKPSAGIDIADRRRQVVKKREAEVGSRQWQ